MTVLPGPAASSTAAHAVIVGGGVMGSATAWFLAHEHGWRVTVLERDASYARASSALSVCSIRQQFSTPINVQLSQQSLFFYRELEQQLGLGDETPSLGLVEPGYLYLTATDEGVQRLRRQQQMQQALGVHTAHLTGFELHARFPWLHTSDLRAGSLGLSSATSGEGWFDGYAALQAFRSAARRIGVLYCECDATDFVVDRAAGESVVTAVRTASGDVIRADALVVAAGAWSAVLGERLGVSLPVRARKRDVFAFEASAEAAAAPLVIDPSGVWFRPEVQAGRYLCGAPPRDADPDDVPLDRVDHGLFDDVIWPALAARVPVFDALRVTSRWAGYYEMNVFDQNGLVGPLPGYRNAFAACGFSGHGLQQAPAVGRGVAERIALGAYRTLDLSPLGVERVHAGDALREWNVI